MRLLKATLVCLLGAGCAAEPGAREKVPVLTLSEVSASLDGVKLSWVVSEPSAGTPEAQFSVERQEIPSERWLLIAGRLPATDHTYVDRDLEPGLRYRYRISARVGEERVASAETSEPIDGPPPWQFQFRNPTLSAKAGKGMVTIRIQKFEKGVGKVEISHIHYDRDRIGWWEEEVGADPGFRHRAKLPGGKFGEVGFDTGATLRLVVPATLIVDVKRCRPLFDKATGNRVDCDQLLERRSLEVYQIFYVDPGGEHQVTVPDPATLDQLCDRHRVNPGGQPKKR